MEMAGNLYRLMYARSEIQDRFLCGICFDVMMDAMETSCGHYYCEQCLREALNRTRMVCPVCQTELDESNIHPLVSVRREIDNLNVYCANKEKGCTFMGPVRNMQDHARLCTVNMNIGEDGNGTSGSSKKKKNTTRRASVTEEELNWHDKNFRGCCKSMSLIRTLLVAMVVVVAVVIVVGIAVFVGYKFSRTETDTTSWLKQTCTIPGELCSDGTQAIQLRCDSVTSVCLLQVQQSCAEHTNACITGAVCEKISQQCRCQDNFQTLNNVCVLKRGEWCTEGYEHLCGPEKYCDVDETGQCQCLQQYEPSGDRCYLKAEVAALDCRSDASCVEHSTCSKSGICTCDKDFYVLWDGTCGLKVEVPGSDCSQVTSCVEHAYCDTESHQCLCDHMFIPRSDGTCGLKIGAGLNCRQVDSCVDYATCDRGSKQCVCKKQFSARSDGTCGLKAERTAFDCRSDISCVENASCNSTGICFCDRHFHVKRNGTCGYQVGLQVPGNNCSKIKSCVDNAVCSSLFGSSECRCNKDFGVRLDHTCGRKVGESGVDCRSGTGCVENASCDRTTGQCVCDQHFHARLDATCGFEVGRPIPDSGDCRAIGPCVDNASCSIFFRKCSCDINFSPLPGRTCGLKVDVDGIDCRQVKSCVQYAHCMDTGAAHQCQCLSHQSVKKAVGTCGLIPQIPVDDCSTAICADGTSCMTDKKSGKYMCQCGHSKHWDFAKNSCQHNEAHRHVLRWPAVTAWVGFTFLLSTTVLLH